MLKFSGRAVAKPHACLPNKETNPGVESAAIVTASRAAHRIGMSSGRRMILPLNLAFFVAISAATPAATQGHSRPPSILILNPAPAFTGYQEISSGLRSTLKTITKSPVAVYEENLDLIHFGGESYNALILGYVRQKYTNKPIDVLVAIGAQALTFALQARVEFSTSMPVVFAAVDEASIAGTEKSLTASNVTGAAIRFSFSNSIAAAVGLVPGLKTIVVIGDPFERQPFRRKFKDQLTEPSGRPDVDRPSGDCTRRGRTARGGAHRGHSHCVHGGHVGRSRRPHPA